MEAEEMKMMNFLSDAIDIMFGSEKMFKHTAESYKMILQIYEKCKEKGIDLKEDRYIEQFLIV